MITCNIEILSVGIGVSLLSNVLILMLLIYIYLIDSTPLECDIFSSESVYVSNCRQSRVVAVGGFSSKISLLDHYISQYYVYDPFIFIIMLISFATDSFHEKDKPKKQNKKKTKIIIVSFSLSRLALFKTLLQMFILYFY